jgi:hypothetical protein
MLHLKEKAVAKYGAVFQTNAAARQNLKKKEIYGKTESDSTHPSYVETWNICHKGGRGPRDQFHFRTYAD